MSVVMVLAASLFGLGDAHAGSLQRIDLDKDEVALVFDGAVDGARGLVLQGPDRIAIDVEGAQTGAASMPGSGIVRSIRRAQFDPGTARVVLDLDRPAVISGGQFTADGTRLVLTIGKAAPGTAATAPMRFEPPSSQFRRPPANQYKVRVALPPARSAVGLPKIEGPDDASLPLVVVDAGHGGHDPGAISPHGGLREKDLTLALARLLRDEMLATGRVRVALTRNDDRFLVLQERYGIARRLRADLFISVHADAAASPDAHGATVYTLSETASDREAARLAARENRADVLNGIDLGSASSDVSSILIDLSQRETMNLSADFARLLVREGRDHVQFRSEAHRHAGFVVLKAPDIPSVLLESGYLTNERDVERLGSADGRRALARAVASAVTVHFAKQLAAR